MGLESIYGVMKISMRANGRCASDMDKAMIGLRAVITTWASTAGAKPKATVNMAGAMDILTADSSTMG